MFRKMGLFGVFGWAVMSVGTLSARGSADHHEGKGHVGHALHELMRSALSNAHRAKVSPDAAFGQNVQRDMVNVRYPLTIFHAGRGQHERWFARGAMMANLIYLSHAADQNMYLKSLATGSLMWLKENVTATGGNIEHVMGAEDTAKHLDEALAHLRAGHGHAAAQHVAHAAHSLKTGLFYNWYYIAGFTIASLQWDARLGHDKAIHDAHHSIDELLKQAPKAGANDAVTASIEVHPGIHASLRRLMSLVGQKTHNYGEILKEATVIQSYAVT